MKRVFVDTGAWYALADANDPDHGRVVPCFRDFHGRLVTSNFVVDEILTLARFRLGWSVAHRLGAQLRSGRLSRVERTPSATAFRTPTPSRPRPMSSRRCVCTDALSR